uniref:HDC15815 n=1 Tax=Drosophila melanogaster TaxID=7227 RepID=Q6IJ58_DROME|nr:TPA_inf: HDC15815 [Drosophila melanogaster]
MYLWLLKVVVPHLATFAARQKDNDKKVDNNAGRQGYSSTCPMPHTVFCLAGCRPDCCHCELNFRTISAGCSFQVTSYHALGQN